jgi:2-polyprenyl-3-methyl-5-hydroxy-6-metoxy-1,4-benzoquinol methylase
VDFLESLKKGDAHESLNHDLHSAWKTYLGEAQWGWFLLSDEINALDAGAKVLEIGAGPRMLSTQVASQGMDLTSIEPASQGFSVMEKLGRILDNLSVHQGISYEFTTTKAEDFLIRDKFEFAYSINVMEHVDDIEIVLTNVFNALVPNGQYHFVCPNYAFPFEPHFNSFTFINRRLTEVLLKSRLLAKSNHQDPTGLWDSLNWIKYSSVKSWAVNKNDVELIFSRRALNMYIARAIEDEDFQLRHPKLSKLTRKMKPIVCSILSVTPVRLLPILDVTVIKKSS